MSRQRGFTLIELLVVVAIVGVFMAVAIAFMGGEPAVIDEASATANLLRESSRKAVAGGAVRADVADANLLNARTRVVITPQATGAIVALERAEEHPLPSDEYDWVELERHTVAQGVELYGVRDAAELEPGQTPDPLGAPATIECFPNGACEPKTLYFRRASDGADQMRVVVMPLNGAPLVFDQW